MALAQFREDHIEKIDGDKRQVLHGRLIGFFDLAGRDERGRQCRGYAGQRIVVQHLGFYLSSSVGTSTIARRIVACQSVRRAPYFPFSGRLQTGREARGGMAVLRPCMPCLRFPSDRVAADCLPESAAIFLVDQLGRWQAAPCQRAAWPGARRYPSATRFEARA